MDNFYRDNSDLRYYVEKGIDWEPLVRATEYDFRTKNGFKTVAEATEFYADIANLVGEFVATEIAPHAAEIDAGGAVLVDGEPVFSPAMDAIFRSLKNLELHGMCLPRELGGQNAPMILYMINAEMIARGDVSVMTHHSFHGGMAMAMLVFSVFEGTTELDVDKAEIVRTRFADYIDEIRRGEAWGCMDITEPDAGSDMAALRSVGERDDDGNWFVSGQKIFITSGHGKYHFVIARTEKAASADDADPMAGLKGLSMFLVPAWETDENGGRRRIIALDRLEEKMGHHGSATAALTFERAPAHLIGKRGEGFRYMLILMNNARLGVGFESLGLCEAAYRKAKTYAAERRSMGKTIDRHEMIADYLDEMATEIQGIRALAMAGAFHEEMGQKLNLLITYDTKSTDLERKRRETARARHQQRARRLTPLLKYLAAEKAVEMAQRCIQIHGGVGYISEYGAEKLLRDAMVMPIYEGTSQIQSLMAMKDTLGRIMKNPQQFVRRLAQARWRSLSSRDPLERRLAKLQSISLSAQQLLITRTAADKFRALQGEPLASWPRAFFKEWDAKRDFAFAMLHAERLTKLLADEAICDCLWEQAVKHPERRDVLARYLERAEPRCKALLDEINTTGQRLLDTLKRTADNAHAAAS